MHKWTQEYSKGLLCTQIGTPSDTGTILAVVTLSVQYSTAVDTLRVEDLQQLRLPLATVQWRWYTTHLSDYYIRLAVTEVATPSC